MKISLRKFCIIEKQACAARTVRGANRHRGEPSHRKLDAADNRSVFD